MKVLFVAGPGTGSLFSMVPLAQAVRRAGHEVFVAGPAGAGAAVAAAGLVGVPVSSKSLEDCREDRRGLIAPLPPEGHERDIETGRSYGRFAADCLHGLSGLAASWPPDLVVGAAQAYAAPLAAHRLGVPYARFATDLAEPVAEALAAVAELGPELEEAGLYDLPRPVISLSVAPPSLRMPDAPPALPMRHIPYETQRAVEPWAYVKGDRPRILVVGGAADATSPEDRLWRGTLDALLPRLAELDADILVARRPSDADGAPAFPGAPEVTGAPWFVPDEVRCEPVPLGVVAPTCDLVVHPGDALSTLGALAHGLPQLSLPPELRLEEHGARIAELGAGKSVRLAGADLAGVARACGDLLADASYRIAAARLRDEMHALPLPAGRVAELERAASMAPVRTEG